MQREIRNTYSPAFATSPTAETGTSVRQIISDIALLSFWCAMVPAFLWVGNAAGF